MLQALTCIYLHIFYIFTNNLHKKFPAFIILKSDDAERSTQFHLSAVKMVPKEEHCLMAL
jgi:hypothetical protein